MEPRRPSQWAEHLVQSKTTKLLRGTYYSSSAKYYAIRRDGYHTSSAVQSMVLPPNWKIYIPRCQTILRQRMTSFCSLTGFTWPLARANFAHIASHPAGKCGIAHNFLLRSHAAIEANAIYAKAKAAERPSWNSGAIVGSVNEGLNELLNIHSRAAFAGYDAIEAVIEPVLECTQRLLGPGERRLVKALDRLLGPYRQLIDAILKDATTQVENACLALQDDPSNPALLEQIVRAVDVWMSLARPLLLWNTIQRRSELDFDTPIAQLRALIDHLSENKHYEVATQTAELTQELFRAVPTTIDQLIEDARLLRNLSLHAFYLETAGRDRRA